MSDHLKFVIPGAVLAAASAFMLLFGGLFAMIYRMTCSFDMYCSGSVMGPMSTTLIIIGVVLLCCGLVLIAKGVSVYRSGSVSSYKYNRPPAQPVSYTPTTVSTPSYAPTQSPTVILDTPSSVQDPSPPKQSMGQEKKYCPSCGAELPAHSQAHFCPACGGPI